MTKTKPALVEIFTEELPPNALETLSCALQQHVEQLLKEYRLSFVSTKPFATPRRLALYIEGLQLVQADQAVEQKGPPINVAFDAQGQPTKAGLGFAQTCGVDIKQLERMKTTKGEWLVYRGRQKGETAQTLLPHIITAALSQLPIPKLMRWGEGDTHFARPVHAVICLLGKKVVPTTLLGCRTGQTTYGHRFHAPKALRINTPDGYETQLEKAYVIADFKKRQNIIAMQIQQLAAEKNGQVVVPEGLLEEVTSLVEYPVALCGEFDAKFLTLPRELLISVLEKHQKCFAIEDKKRKLLPYFITVSNIKSKQPETVVSGNQRVVLARFSDAAFFFQQDKKVPLDQRLNQLQQVTFEKKLGSLYDKTMRIVELARRLTKVVKADEQFVKRAALLSKTDLTTEMVSEFPELQGTMGCYYARLSGEPDAVAIAIDEQYKPRFAGDELPKTAVGQAIAIADRVDTLVGIFGINQGPTGEKDPFALRRAALGVLRLCIEKRLDVDLYSLIDHAKKCYGKTIENPHAVKSVLHFLQERHRHLSFRQGFSTDIFNAVAAVDPDRLFDFQYRLEAVKTFKQLPDADALSAANKRVKNILEKEAVKTSEQVVKPALFTEPAEKRLFDCLNEKKKEVKRLCVTHDYTQALKVLSLLRPEVDAFFEQVMVMAEDKKLRQNRLALLGELRHLFLQIADISELQ